MLLLSSLLFILSVQDLRAWDGASHIIVGLPTSVTLIQKIFHINVQQFVFIDL